MYKALLLFIIPILLVACQANKINTPVSEKVLHETGSMVGPSSSSTGGKSIVTNVNSDTGMKSLQE